MLRKDPIIRMLLIIILGSIAFQLLFNFISGGGEMDDMSMSTQNMMNNTGSIDIFFSGLLVLLVKFLLIVLIISIMICLVMWIKNSFFKDVNIDIHKYVNQNPYSKTIAGIAGLIFGLFFIMYLFNFISNPNMGYSNSGMDMMTGTSTGLFSNSLGLTGIMTFLIQVLSIVFIISLIIGLLAYFKKQFEITNLPKSDNNVTKESSVTIEKNNLETNSFPSDVPTTNE